VVEQTASGGRLTLRPPAEPDREIPLWGDSAILVETSGVAWDTNGNGLDEAPARLLYLDLESVDGQYRLGLSDRILARGRFEEQVNATPGILDLPPFAPPVGFAWLDLENSLLLEMGAQELETAEPVLLSGETGHAAVGFGDALTWDSSGAPVPLLDGGTPTGFALVDLLLMPNPPPLTLRNPGPLSTTVVWPKPSPDLVLQKTDSLIEPQVWETIPPEEYEDSGLDWSYPMTDDVERIFFRLFRP